MLEFLVDNIFVVFAGKVFQQIVGIPMGTNCAPLLADIFLYSYEAEFIQSLLSTGRKQLASRFNFTYRYIDDVLSINNPEFENYLGQMYLVELEIKDTTESNTSASYLDLLLSIGRDGQLHTSIYDKRDDFNFHITNFPFLSSNIPTSPAYGVFISQLYGMPGLAPRMDVLSWGRRDFQLLFWNRDTSRNAWNRLWGSFMVDTGISSTIWSFPLTNDKWHSVNRPYTMTTPYWSDFVPNSNFYRILSDFHRTFATGVACRQGTLTPPDTWSRPFGTCICSTCWDQSFSKLVVIFPDYVLRIFLGTFSILLILISYFSNYLYRMYTVEFRQKTRREHNHVPLSQMFSCRLERTISVIIMSVPIPWIWLTISYLWFPYMLDVFSDDGSVPEMSIWSILLIISDLKWCIRLITGPVLYFNH